VQRILKLPTLDFEEDENFRSVGEMDNEEEIAEEDIFGLLSRGEIIIVFDGNDGRRYEKILLVKIWLMYKLALLYKYDTDFE
jgi:hypothetical protein